MSGQRPPIVAIVLPRTAAGPALRMQHALATHPGHFTPVILGPPGTPLGSLAHIPLTPSWFPFRAARRYATGLTTALRTLHLP